MEDFISHVKQHRVLYDPSQEKYKDVKFKEDIWLQIALQLESTVKEVKLRWKNLQNSYREAKKRRKGKTGDSAKKFKELPYMQMMTFIDDIREDNRLTTSNIDQPLSSSVAGSSNGGDESTSVLSEEDEFIASASDSSLQKKRVKKDVDFEIIQLMKENAEDRRKLIKLASETDELKQFFDAMCSSTRKLPRHRQLRIKSKIFKFIADEEEDEVLEDSLNDFHNSVDTN